jgi:hypothetical protein
MTKNNQAEYDAIQKLIKVTNELKNKADWSTAGGTHLPKRG